MGDYDYNDQKLGLPIMVAAALIGGSLVVSAYLEGGGDALRAKQRAVGHPSRLSADDAEHIKEQFIHEIEREPRKFKIEEVKNIRVTHTGRVIALDFRYTLVAPNKSGEIGGTKTIHNFELTADSSGRYEGKIRIVDWVEIVIY